ncbi:MAG: glucuronate isomerase, partial [Verrucomicrobiae bacterium]|nr:glucuronate isomerase [Verrucomicrobiae bacterium]
LFEIWLEGDHYKWRAMRCNGTPERLCTGEADPYEKFIAFAKTVPHTLRNPLFHWTHLELKRYFGIETLLDESTAPAIWEQANAKLAEPEMSARGILRQFKVRALCTTDDPTDDLAHHRSIAESGFETKVFPTFRPDKALNVGDPVAFNVWVEKLEGAANHEIATFASFKEALKQRHDFFHACGGRLSDHGLERCPAEFASEAEAEAIFDRARGGLGASMGEREAFAGNLMIFFGELDAEKGWTKQLHLGAMRNNNVRLFKQIGPDIGCDSIGDYPQAKALSAYLGRLDERGALPKTILYNNNPTDNYILATMVGNFQDGGLPGKVQFGSGWWFLDQKEGMEWQINALSNCGLLSRFVGMLTDSRSFMSFPRHEYFRRTLCNLIGQDVEDGLLPDDDSLLGPMIANICYGNARDYLGLGVE